MAMEFQLEDDIERVKSLASYPQEIEVRVRMEHGTETINVCPSDEVYAAVAKALKISGIAKYAPACLITPVSSGCDYVAPPHLCMCTTSPEPNFQMCRSKVR